MSGFTKFGFEEAYKQNAKAVDPPSIHSYGPGGEYAFPTREMLLDLANGSVDVIYQRNEDSAGIAAWLDYDAQAVCIGGYYVPDFADLLEGLPDFPPPFDEDYMVGTMFIESGI